MLLLMKPTFAPNTYPTRSPALTGATGPVGPVGPTGPTGPVGPVGPTGGANFHYVPVTPDPPGVTGLVVPIQSFTPVSSGVLRITGQVYGQSAVADALLTLSLTTGAATVYMQAAISSVALNERSGTIEQVVTGLPIGVPVGIGFAWTSATGNFTPFTSGGGLMIQEI